MTDKLSPERRAANMRAIRSVDMKPEMIVRSVAHRLGYRFRLHHKDLPGKPDLVFPRKHAVIFVHGCFWHQHPDPACSDARLPKTNSGYWFPKLLRNQERDSRAIADLVVQGWTVLVIWECQTKDKKKLEQQLTSFLGVSCPRFVERLR